MGTLLPLQPRAARAVGLHGEVPVPPDITQVSFYTETIVYAPDRAGAHNTQRHAHDRDKELGAE